jgi:hypothetical protein
LTVPQNSGFQRSLGAAGDVREFKACCAAQKLIKTSYINIKVKVPLVQATKTQRGVEL